jgi:hypothetical protein
VVKKVLRKDNEEREMNDSKDNDGSIAAIAANAVKS